MKNLLTLFLTALTALSFAQQSFTGQPKQYKMLPNSVKPSAVHKGTASVSRAGAACDTSDVLDYNTYNEVFANNQQISYNGSWNSSTPQPYGQEINSALITINSADNQIYSYAVQAFDTLAFANYGNSSQYSMSRGSSTVTLDSVGMFIGVAADDTSSTGALVNDSLVISIYSVTAGTVSASPVSHQTYAGHDALQQFVVGTTPGYLRYAQVTVGQTFGLGQGFAVGIQFYSGDTSSHCILAYSYADSCGTITFQGNQYTSPAYPSPFIGTAKYAGNVGCAFWGEIDSTTPTSASVRPISNGFAYNITGIPANCSYVYNQNWEIISYVTVQNTLGAAISGANPIQLACPTTAHPIVTANTGDLAGASYNWSSGQTTANISILYPGTYSLTVTNPLGCSATASVDAAYSSGANATPNFTTPAQICVNQPAAFANTSSDTTNFNSHWNFGQGADSLSTLISPSHTYTAAGTYPVSLVITNSTGCSFGVTQIVTVSPCGVGIKDVEFDNSVRILPNPSNGNINITVNDVEGNITITLYNLIGETVKSFATTESSSVFNKNMDLSNLANGTYMVKIQSGNKIATKKLVITK